MNLNNSCTPKLSIVIATYRRPEQLAQLFNSLREQTASKEDFEIVVVDNEIQPNLQVQALCTSTQYQELQRRYIHHAQLGQSGARNHGIREAHAELVAFLDDDTLPPPGWVAQVLKVRVNSEVDIFGGPYTPFYTTTPPKWFKGKYGSVNFGDHAHWLPKNKYLSAGNMVWNRDLILNMGGFSEDFGYKGKIIRYGEDSELCQRAHMAGIGIWYDPSLTLKHHCRAERMSVRWKLNSKMRHSRMKAALVIRETRLTDKRPVFQQFLSIFHKFILEIIRFPLVCCMAPFRNRNEYPYLENYIVEKIGRELRQISLLFAMMQYILSATKETRMVPK